MPSLRGLRQKMKELGHFVDRTLGQGLGQAMANIWPRWPKFGLEKNFCSVVWKPILSDQAESEGSMAKNEGVG